MTGYFNNLTSHKNLDSIDGDFERPPNIPIDKDVIYCFWKCYRNTTRVSKPLVIASLILNSSFSTQENVSNTNYISATTLSFQNSSTWRINSSIPLAEGEDYPNYNEYFAQDGESHSSGTQTINSTTELISTYLAEFSNSTEDIFIDNNIFNNTLWSTNKDESSLISSTAKSSIQYSSIKNELNIEDEKDKYTDYLTYIISSIDNESSSENKSENKSPLIYNITSTYESSTTISNDIETTPDEGESIVITTNEQIVDISSTLRSTEIESEITTYEDAYFPSRTTEATNNNCIFSSDHDEDPPLCEWVCEEEKPINMTEVGYLIRKMNNTDRKKLRSLCWETMFGQDLIKLTVMDLIMTFLSTIALDFFRAFFVRVMNNCWCWDLEKKFPKYSDFKVAENILHLVNNQGIIWMGLFFSPGLAVVNVVKLFVLMYLRAWTVLTCNVPPEVIFRASKSNNFYYALLLMMLFLCTLPVGYAMVVIQPSWYCGPFSGYKRMYTILTETIFKITPRSFDHALQYAVSPGSIIPLLVLLILVIYYLTSLASSLREANAELKVSSSCEIDSKN